MQTCQHTLTANAIQAPSPEMGMANPVDKTVGSSDYQEPLDSDDQEPKARTIGNRNHLQTSGIVGKYGPLTMLTNNPVGLLLTRQTARGSSALWDAPSPRTSRLGGCKNLKRLLGIER
jgi:hypothetical protein